jgi:hypothetical protein
MKRELTALQAVCTGSMCAYLGWVLPANTLYVPFLMLSGIRTANLYHLTLSH